MSETQRQNARARAAGGYRVMPPIIKNKSADVYYRNAMDRETDRMLSAILSGLARVYTSIRVQNAAPNLTRPSIKNIEKLLDYYRIEYTPIFVRNSEKIIQKWLERSTRNIRRSVTRSLQNLYGDDKFTIPWDASKYGEIMRLIIKRNVALIRNTTSQTLSNIENIVFDGVVTGQNWRAVEKDLRTQKHIAHDRIKRIARDQTGKANEALNQLMQRSAGVQFFEWKTVGDERVSTGYGGHKQLDGKIYKYGDTVHYPVVDSYGHRGLPHQRPNCRCTAEGIILANDYEARQTADGDWIIKKGRL